MGVVVVATDMGAGTCPDISVRISASGGISEATLLSRRGVSMDAPRVSTESFLRISRTSKKYLGSPQNTWGVSNESLGSTEHILLRSLGGPDVDVDVAFI